MCTVFKHWRIEYAHRRIVMHDQQIARLQKELDELKDYLGHLDVFSCNGIDVDDAKVSTIRAIKAVEKEIAKFRLSRSRIFKKYLNKFILKKAEDEDNEKI